MPGCSVWWSLFVEDGQWASVCPLGRFWNVSQIAGCWTTEKDTHVSSSQRRSWTSESRSLLKRYPFGAVTRARHSAYETDWIWFNSEGYFTEINVDRTVLSKIGELNHFELFYFYLRWYVIRSELWCNQISSVNLGKSKICKLDNHVL